MITGALALSMAACGTSKAHSRGTLGTPQIVAASSPATSPSAATTPTPTPTVTKTTPPPAKALTCAQTKFAEVGSATISYNGYHDSIPLGGGLWSGEDGNTVTLQSQCGIGDLTGDGAKDALGVVMLNGGGTGQFYTLVVWKNVSHSPKFWALKDIGDRNPVIAIGIAGQIATVQYCTRQDSSPMAVLDITRTATFKLSGHTLSETGHSDVDGECHPS
jgi:hypothetical protein